MKFARLLKVVFTLIAVAFAALLCWRFYDLYNEHPWTRDGQVRAYVVGIAARVDGPMVEVYVKDNQWVEVGDPLFEIDPTDYEKAVHRTEAALQRSKTVAANLKLEVERRRDLVAQELISLEEFQSLEAQYVEAVADIAVDEAELELANLNLSYTKINAPVSGYITNLEVTTGTYVTTGQALMALVDANSFWISAYFKETDLAAIQPGDRVRIIMMGDFFEPFHGEVESVSWGIYREDGSSNQNTQLPIVKPTVDWVRLAQRFPVRIKPHNIPSDIQLRVGQTVSVIIDPISESEKTPQANQSDYPKTLTDGRGDATTLHSTPMRVISLAPSTTQWMHALGVEDRLVGVTEHCEVGESSNAVARYAVYPNPSYELILAAAPDLIITADIADRRHVERLRELGLDVLVCNHDGYDGILRDANTLSDALGSTDLAQEVVGSLTADREAVQASVENRDRVPRILYALSPRLDFAAGPNSYADSLITLAGAENVAGDAQGLWPKLSRESVIEADPDVIVVTHSMEAGAELARADVIAQLQSDPIWRELSAVKNDQIAVVDSQLLNVPGPQTGQALRHLHDAIWSFYD
ncbi:MAG: efflux RND transporter periplasmic adaptor subunit [Verrucomicrobiota bacterium]